MKQTATKSSPYSRLLLTSVLLVVAGALCNDWLPTGLLDGLDSPRYRERRILFRILSSAMIVSGLLVAVFRAFLANRGKLLIAVVVAGAIPLVLFACGDIYLGHVALRSSAASASERFIMHDPLLSWTLLPDFNSRQTSAGNYDVTYRFDSDGFRTIANSGTADRTIYFFGDSYAFGHGVENVDCFPNIIADEYLVDGISVRNGSVPAYGIEQIYGRFLRSLDRVNPGDVVVIAPISADLRRNLEDFYDVGRVFYHEASDPASHFPVYRDGELVPHFMESTWLASYSYIFVGEYTRKLFRFLHQAIRAPDSNERARMMIAQAKRLTEERGADFVFTFLPHPSELRRGRYREDVSEFDFTSVWSDFPHGDDAEAIHFPTDNHWNAKGHRLAAAAMVRVFLDRGLLSEDDLLPNAPIDGTSQLRR